MSTFFEKLTGGNLPEESAIEPIAARASTLRLPRKSAEEAKSTHLKIAADPVSETEQETAEEEGELTVDIYDRGDSIVIQSTVAGVKPEDLDISITNDSVTLKGRREQHEEVEDKNYYYKELFWGAFSRSVILPEEIDEDLAEATLKHGLLTIKLPKKRRGVVQKLKVKVT